MADAAYGVRVERLHCPIEACPWIHDRVPPTDMTATLPVGESPFHDGAPATLAEAIADAAYATLLADALAIEPVVRGHLETHTLLEWVAEVMRLREFAVPREALDDLLAVAAYVSLGRRAVDHQPDGAPYPDAQARRALGAIREAQEARSA